VIAFHLGATWLPGGFIGVDVFFVLSGYLITGLLVDELARRGRVDLAHFYARRVRRLLPAAALVIAVVIAGTLALMDRVDHAMVGDDATFSALYSVNWHFGLGGRDYFAAGDVPSPLIHFWSLAVEEQFYLVWPALLLGLWAAARRLKPAPAPASITNPLLGSVLVLTAISATASLLLPDGPLTYYGTHTRAYQLLAGAALAIVARRAGARPLGDDAADPRIRRAGAALGMTALAVLALLAHEIADTQFYPGLAGLAVTAAGVALIAALDLMGSHPLRRLAGARLPAAIGRLSYSLYLWHWPTIVFLPLLARRYDVDWPTETPTLVVVMTLAAVLSYRLWERPLRFRAGLRLPSRRVVLAGLAVSAALGVTSIQLMQPHSAFEAHALASVKDFAKPGDCPYFGRDWPSPASSHACVLRRGSPGAPTLAFVGDSHAHQWQPALQRLAARYDLTLIRATRAACPANDVTVDRQVIDQELNGSGQACDAWRHQVYPDLVTRYDPDIVFVATRSHVSALRAHGRRIAPFTAPQRRLWSAGWDWTLRTLGAGGARIVVSEIQPTLPQRVPACLADAGKPTSRCDFPADGDRKVRPYNATIRGLAKRAPRVSIFDPVPIGCPGGVCRALSHGVVVHRDDNHLSATFVGAHAHEFETALQRAGVDLAKLSRRRRSR
jgi:peptidoglycan/LPS O-acetylase OafA/YrhL